MAKRLFLMASLVALMSACQSDEFPTGTDIAVDSQSQIKIAGLRSIDPGSIASSDDIWVWVGKNSDDDFAKAWHLTTTDGSTFSGTAKYWPGDGKPLSFKALHGNFTTLPTENTTLWSDLSLTHSVEHDQTTDAAIQKSELLYAAVEDATNGNEVELHFQHLMTKITVVIDCANSSGIEKLTGSKIEIPGVKTTATFSSATSVASANDGTTKDITIASIMSQPTTTFECSAVIPEQTVASGSELIRLTLADGQVIKYKKTNDNKFLAGNEYKITLTVNASEGTLNVSGFEVAAGNTRETTDWEYHVPIN